MRLAMIPVMAFVATLLLAGGSSAGPAEEGGTADPRAPAAPEAAGAAENPFLGGVPEPSTEAGPLNLTLREAVERGLRNNLGALLAEQGVQSAEAGRDEARGGLLPLLSAGMSGTRQVINLEAYGFPPPAGESPLVGPFNVLDARAYLDQPLFDPAALQRWRAGGKDLDAARLGYRDAREMVVVTCAALYLQAAQGASRIDAARSQEAVARALHDRAEDLKASGVVAGIDVLRAKVQLQAQRQRVISSENEYAKEKLVLARAIGLPLSRPFELADKLVYVPAAAPEAEEALQEAVRSRPDLKAAEAALSAAETLRGADRADGLPSLRLNADLGWIGTGADSLEKTYTVAAGMRIPLYQAGRVHARVQQDDAEIRRLRARRDDLLGRLELEVRSALLDLQAADARVQVGKEALDLAQEELRQSRDRFTAGVSDNLEVVQAQDAVASASDSYLAALYAHNLARLALARARGAAESSMADFLPGEKGASHE